MMRLSGVLVLLYLYFMCFGASAQDSIPAIDSIPVIKGELKKWHPLSLTFTGPEVSENDTANPFLNYRLNVTFTNRGKTYTVPGYFAADGNAAESSATSGNKWRVHFTPDEIGTWTYYASFRTGNQVAVDENPNSGVPLAFDGATGSFQIQDTDKSGVDHRGKGILRYVGEHHLQFAETGEYYIKGGADSPENFLGYLEFDGTKDHGGLATPGLTDGLHVYAPHIGDWQVGDPSWQDGKGKGIIGAINYLSSVGGNSIYFLTYNTDGGDGRDSYMWVSPNDKTRYDVSKLDQWEIVFSHMDVKGIQLHFVVQEVENNHTMGSLSIERRLYFRELVARFSHHLALQWNLGEENSNKDYDKKAFSSYIRSVDPYDHPITVHTFFDEASSYYNGIFGHDAFEATSIQGTTNRYNEWAIELRRKSANAGRKWAIYGDEQAPVVSPNNGNLNQLRKGLWHNLMGGGAGVEWYFGYQNTFGDIQSEDWRIVEPLWVQTKHALDFFQTHIPFHEMAPDNSLATNGAKVLAKPGQIYALYVQNGGNTNLNLEGTEEEFRVRWYDPRNGGLLQAGSADSVVGPGWVSIGLPPESTEGGNDWIAIIGHPNLAPVFQLSSNQIKLNQNFTTTESIQVIPAPIPADEQEQIVTYSLDPSAVSFANVSIDSLTGEIIISGVEGQTGSQVFTVTADDGQEVNHLHTEQFVLTVSAPRPPIANMNVNPVSGVAPLNVSFNGSLSEDLNGPISHYIWNFGDGSTTDTDITNHVYHHPGTYQATLTVVDEDGMMHTQHTTIEVRAASENLLFVVGNMDLNPGDQAILDSLQTWGYSVNIKDQNSVTSLDANDAEMVLISSTVQSTTINTTFTNVDVPVMVWEPYLYDDMQMTGTSAEVSFGQLSGENTLAIDSAASEIVAIAPQITTITTTPQNIAWGRPTSTAIPIGLVSSDSSQMGIFAYPAGTMMEGMLAPAIRIGMFWQDNTPIHTTPEAWNIFRELICWATNCNEDTATSNAIQLAAIPDQLNELGEEVSLSIQLIDSLANHVTISVEGLPQGVSFNDSTLTLGGNIEGEVGVYPVQVTISDSDTTIEDASISFTWIVFEPQQNLPPQIAYIADRINEQGDIVSLFLEATDEDGDALVYTAEGLPDGLMVDSLSGEIYGIVTDSVGIYDVQVSVWDKGFPPKNSYLSFHWEVIYPLPNQAPILAMILDQRFEEEDEVSIPLVATDPDEEDLVYFSAFGLPSGLSIDTASHSISGQLNDTIGIYSITVIAQDNGIPIERDTLTFLLSIEQRKLEALLLVGNTNLNMGDEAIVSELEYLGYEVEVIKDIDSETISALGKDLIFISSTVNSASVGDKFTNTQIPIICTESYLYDDLKMVESTANFGTVTGQNSVEISDSTHIASAGFSGLVNTTTVNQEKSWGAPNEHAKIIASLSDDNDKAKIFSYDAQTELFGLVAPAKRMGFFLRDETAAYLTEEGWALFDAAVCWAAGCRPAEARKSMQQKESISFSVYPNPVSSILTIKLSPNTNSHLKIYDLLGKVWIQQNDMKGKVKLNVDNLISGIYILQITADNKVENVKIVKR